MAGVAPRDVDVAELHDAFTILKIVESEEVGFFKKGQGHLALERGETRLGGKLPINTSGGLKAKGHPVGATGVGQAHEIILQLRGEAEKRQVKGAKIGFIHARDKIGCRAGTGRSRIDEAVLPPSPLIKEGQHTGRPRPAHGSAFHHQRRLALGV
jgi:acetyl-CoA C-acetyltransferase